MAIKLLGHVWRNGVSTPAEEPRRRGNEWVVELREPSRWNPVSAYPSPESSAADDAPLPEPTWAETQPCCHD